MTLEELKEKLPQATAMYYNGRLYEFDERHDDYVVTMDGSCFSHAQMTSKYNQCSLVKIEYL